MYYLIALCFVVSLTTVLILLKFASKIDLIDYPNIRSSHAKPTPRGGGLGIVLGILVPLIIFYYCGDLPLGSAKFYGLISSIFLVALIGFLDDMKGLSQLVRLLSQIAASVVFVATVGAINTVSLPFIRDIHLGNFAAPLTILWIVAFANIFNFMDGIDGLAAGEAVIAGFFLALLGLMQRNHTILFLSLLISSSSLAFLIFNFPPAKIFMGDVGSTTLGFLFACLAVIGSQKSAGPIPFVAVLLVLGLFIFDATVTLVKRVLRREQWYKAHRDHHYQKALVLGYSHRQITMVGYCITFLLGVTSLAYIRANEPLQIIIIISWGIALSCIFLWVSSRKPIHE